MGLFQYLINKFRIGEGMKKHSLRKVEQPSEDAGIIISKEVLTEDMAEQINNREEKIRSDRDSVKNSVVVECVGSFRTKEKIETKLYNPFDDAKFGGYATPGYTFNFIGYYISRDNQVWLQYKHNMRIKYVKICEDLHSGEFKGTFLTRNPLTDEIKSERKDNEHSEKDNVDTTSNLG